jgi:hypothetical protein
LRSITHEVVASLETTAVAAADAACGADALVVGATVVSVAHAAAMSATGTNFAVRKYTRFMGGAVRE